MEGFVNDKIRGKMLNQSMDGIHRRSTLSIINKVLALVEFPVEGDVHTRIETWVWTRVRKELSPWSEV